jgi:multiple sugar transport system permease protein
VGPFLAISAFALIAPVAYAIYLSLFRNQLVGGTTFTGLGNYHQALTDPRFWDSLRHVPSLRRARGWFGGKFALWSNIQEAFTYDNGIFVRWLENTLLYVVVGAGGATFLATLAGYGMAKYDFPGKRAVFAVVLGAVAVPGTALAVPTFLLFSRLHLTNTPWSIILPSLISPFGLYLIWIYAQDAIPAELLEAARIDGAGEFRTFFTISLRLLAPGLATVLLFTVVATWNNYFLPLIMLSDPRWYPLTVGLNDWNAQSSTAGGQAIYNLVITGSLLTVIRPASVRPFRVAGQPGHPEPEQSEERVQHGRVGLGGHQREPRGAAAGYRAHGAVLQQDDLRQVRDLGAGHMGSVRRRRKEAARGRPEGVHHQRRGRPRLCHQHDLVRGRPSVHAERHEERHDQPARRRVHEVREPLESDDPQRPGRPGRVVDQPVVPGTGQWQHCQPRDRRLDAR